MQTINIFKTNKILLLPAIIVILGILFHSSVFFYINTVMPPDDMSYTQISAELINNRLALRTTAEKVFSLSSALSMLISVILLYMFIKKGRHVPYSKLIYGFIASTVFACLFSVPFSLLDRNFSSDYILPFITSWPAITVLFLILMLLNWGKKEN